MANSIKIKEQVLAVGDTITIDYKIKEADNKERIQPFMGILIKIKGMDDATRMITVRKMSKTGIGIERIFPVSSPFIGNVKLEKKSYYTKAKLYFLPELSDQKLRRKLYATRNK
jgi:large subunit ribosomal protein L19